MIKLTIDTVTLFIAIENYLDLYNRTNYNNCNVDIVDTIPYSVVNYGSRTILFYSHLPYNNQICRVFCWKEDNWNKGNGRVLLLDKWLVFNWKILSGWQKYIEVYTNMDLILDEKISLDLWPHTTGGCLVFIFLRPLHVTFHLNTDQLCILYGKCLYAYIVRNFRCGYY